MKRRKIRCVLNPRDDSVTLRPDKKRALLDLVVQSKYILIERTGDLVTDRKVPVALNKETARELAQALLEWANGT